MTRQRIGYFENRQDPEQICSRCRMCELICSFHHHQVGNPRRSAIRIVLLGKGVDIPVTCLNCEDPPCMNICPTGALFQSEPDSMVTVKEDLCIGCAMCVNACPVGAITLDPVDGVALKCDLCDGDPQCVAYCPASVLKLTDADRFVRHRMKEFAKFLQAVGEGS
ncbi:MAG: 4Fe-4S dicluster domain-containing protein [Proteobacteria bacterium]|nr:4Fe-4S dicluster domain-containing protein [Pseudomonadota bacterium]